MKYFTFFALMICYGIISRIILDYYGITISSDAQLPLFMILLIIAISTVDNLLDDEEFE